jgi:hypothetical protein
MWQAPGERVAPKYGLMAHCVVQTGHTLGNYQAFTFGELGVIMWVTA